MKVQNTKASIASPLAAVIFALAGIQYVVLEAIAASAWRHPMYNYAVDFISDLGNPVADDTFDGRLINSPLNVVMDIAFVAQGALFIAAAVMLYRKIQGKVRIVLLVLAVVQGVGVIMVGFFHESAAALTNGVIVFHSIGAASTIVCGNVIFIVVGIIGSRLGAASWYRVFSITVGALGLVAFIVLQVDHPLYVAAGGIPERIAVYTIMVWEIVTGVTLLIARRRSSRA